MLYDINPLFNKFYMKKVFLCLFLIFMLFPISSGFSQVTDTKPTLSVVLTSDSPYIYHDEEGYTVVVGSIKNTNPLTAVSDVKIRATFYDDISVTPIEIVQGRPILEVIPSLGTSPYMIKSKTPNPQITQASVFLETFDSSISKSKLLTIESSDIYVDENLVFSGILKNGPASITNTNVYMAFYDAFQPPRILGIHIIPIGEMEPNAKTFFEFNDKIEPQIQGFLLFSESNIFYSNSIDVKIPGPEVLTKHVTISDVSITDSLGKKLSEIKQGSTVKIQSNSLIELSPDHKSNEIPYTYYVQVKESGEKPYVEFIGKYDGRYIGEGSQSQSIDWIPEKKGIFFIETFVWDRSNLPIADPGPIAIILVN